MGKRLKDEQYGDFIIRFYGDKYIDIEAEALYMGSRAAVGFGKTKKEALTDIKKTLGKRYPLQVPKKR